MHKYQENVPNSRQLRYTMMIEFLRRLKMEREKIKKNAKLKTQEHFFPSLNILL
jgi:hypothetical protein